MDTTLNEPRRRFVDGRTAPDAGDTVYAALARHQITQDWDTRDLSTWLHKWSELFIFGFKLEITTFALAIDWLRAGRLGHFRHGFNGFGLRGEIALNRRYLDESPYEVLGTLLHELLHAEQEENGKPGKRNYHNKAFRLRAIEFGLVVDAKGHQRCVTPSPFQTLLLTHGVDMPSMPPVERRPKEKGRSKLRRWVCACGPIRVGRSRFRARCIDCNSEFRLDD